MAIEATVANVHVSPQVVGTNAGSQQPVIKVEGLQKQNPKPVPEAPKIDIDRQPIISTTELEAKIVELNEAMVSRNQAVLFSTDAATGKDVVRVSNKTTGELIRQMPSVEALKAMQNIDQMMGLIFNQKT
jgi:flagellar protein FlaG|tara:strand:- start:870 stop:1259 length:390 start_codon:yes stop_codon:yes gene_type:complete